MNQRRVVGILQELATAHGGIGALQAELAEAMAEDKPRKERARRRIEPKNPPTKEAVDFVRRKLRTLGMTT
jgi:hypothetical protein